MWQVMAAPLVGGGAGGGVEERRNNGDRARKEGRVCNMFVHVTVERYTTCTRT